MSAGRKNANQRDHAADLIAVLLLVHTFKGFKAELINISVQLYCTSKAVYTMGTEFLIKFTVKAENKKGH